MRPSPQRRGPGAARHTEARTRSRGLTPLGSPHLGHGCDPVPTSGSWESHGEDHSVPETPAPPRASSTARAGPRVGQGACPSPRVHSAAQDSPADVRGVPLSCPALLRERRACRWLAASAGWERGLTGGQTLGPSGHLTRGAPWHEAASAQTAWAPSGGQHGLALSTLCSENGPQHTLLSPSSTWGVGGTPHHPQAWPRKR